MSKALPDICLIRKVQIGIFWLFMIDLLLFGAGKNIPGLEISSRKVLFALFAAASIVVFVVEYTERRMLDAALLCVATIFFLIWVIVIPLVTHGTMHYAVADATPLVSLGIFLLSTDFAAKRGHWRAIRRFVLWFVIGFALVHFGLYVLFRLVPDTVEIASTWMGFIFDVGLGDDARFVFFTPLDTGVYRIYFGSSFFLLLGLYFVASGSDRFGAWPWRRSTCLLGLTLLALWATNTRSLMLATTTFIIVFPVSLAYFRAVKPRFWAVFVMLALPFVCSFALIPTVDPTVLQSFGLGRNVSDNVRADQFGSLLTAIGNSPLVGFGFGSSAIFVRSEDAPYAYELSILALFMKIGLGGFLLACGIWATALHAFVSARSAQAHRKFAALYALYFSFVFGCFYNPYIFGFFGTFFLLFVLYEFTSVMGEQDHD